MLVSDQCKFLFALLLNSAPFWLLALIYLFIYCFFVDTYTQDDGKWTTCRLFPMLVSDMCKSVISLAWNSASFWLFSPFLTCLYTASLLIYTQKQHKKSQVNDKLDVLRCFIALFRL